MKLKLAYYRHGILPEEYLGDQSYLEEMLLNNANFSEYYPIEPNT